MTRLSLTDPNAFRVESEQLMARSSNFPDLVVADLMVGGRPIDEFEKQLVGPAN